MKRIELACYGLLVSAFLLAGMLMVQLQGGGSLTSTAEAEMALTRGDLTVMTAQTKSNEEALFVMDNVSGELHVFTLDISKQRLQRNQSRQLNKIFGNRDKGGGEDRDGR